MAEQAMGKETLRQQGKVRQVSQKWMVHEDGAIAQSLQQKEFQEKKNFNVTDRKIARVDVPQAKLIQSAEEERLQRERLSHLERQKIIMDVDREIAARIQVKESRKVDDERTKEDAIIASQVQTAEFIEAEKARVRMEMEDQRLAAIMQQHEKEKAGLRKQERLVAKERKALQREQTQMAGQAGLRGIRMEGTEREELSQGFRDMCVEDSVDPNKVLREDGRLEDEGDFQDFYIQPTDDMDTNEQRELQELQDEELARLLQDQEKKRGAAVDRHKLKEIEERDAEIARLIYEQEKLKKAKRDKARQLRREGRGVPHEGGGQRVVRDVYRHETRTEEHRSQRGGNVNTTRIEEHTTVENGVERTRRHHHTHTERIGSDGEVRGGGVGGGYGRELPPYREPPPISASPHRGGSVRHQDRLPEGQLSQRSNSSGYDTPPYERPPVPPHRSNYTEYASRPLPDTPGDPRYDTHIEPGPADRGINSNAVFVASQHGYAVPNKQRQQPASSQPVHGDNVFTALDPTFQARSGEDQSPPNRPSQSNHSFAASKAQGAMGSPGAHSGEDPYADLNEVGPAIQNQKRTSSAEKTKKESCKQQ